MEQDAPDQLVSTVCVGCCCCCCWQPL